MEYLFKKFLASGNTKATSPILHINLSFNAGEPIELSLSMLSTWKR
jgi:hypothetical protein